MTSVRIIDGQMKGVGREFNLTHFREEVAAISTVEDVAKVVVKIASFYAPDYGKVGHIQKVVITSLLQHFCSSYGTAAA